MNKNLNILIVDDDKETSQLVKQILEIFGYHSNIARSGQLALTIAKEQSPDIILLDVMMPDMDGIEVCRRLKSDPSTANSIVILLTALTDGEIKFASGKAGADRVLGKPFDVNKFVETIEEISGGNQKTTL
jgi:DNA-binding response OmpR family regulator